MLAVRLWDGWWTMSFSPPHRNLCRSAAGWVEKLNLCVSNRILAQDTESVVAPYRAKAETGSADWRCEYWGKWFTSLTLADAYHTTPANSSSVILEYVQ